MIGWEHIKKGNVQKQKGQEIKEDKDDNEIKVRICNKRKDKKMEQNFTFISYASKQFENQFQIYHSKVRYF